MLERPVKCFVLGWLLLNLIALPAAAVYNEDIGHISKEIRKEEANMGLFGKVSVITIGHIGERHEKVILLNGLANDEKTAAVKEADNSLIKTKKPILLIYAVWFSLIGLCSAVLWQRSRKSQITVFLILAIVIAILFGFIFYVKSNLSKKQMKDVDKIYSDFLTTSGIKNYVRLCLENATKEALLLEGRQGGKLYDYQISPYGELSSRIRFSFKHENYTGNLSYDLTYAMDTRQSGTYAGIQYLDPPGYPYKGNLATKPYANNSDLYPFGIGRENSNFPFGLFPMLCSFAGPNRMDFPDYNYSCYLYSPTSSIQNDMEIYIANKTLECLNFSAAYESGYNITAGSMNISFLFGEADVVADMDYPLTISVEGEPPITKFFEYHTKQPVRFKLIYELATKLLERDAQDIFFDMVDDADALNNCPVFDPETRTRNEIFNRSCIEEGMRIERFKDYCLGSGDCAVVDSSDNYSDIYAIIDKNSTIDGREYAFIFAVANRAPVLDYIDESINETTRYFQAMNLDTRYTNLNLTKVYNKTAYAPAPDNYSIVVDEGDKIEIFPYAKDPDEEYEPRPSLAYSYGGWLTNASLGYVDPVNNRLDTYYLWTGTNEWESSDYYTYGYNQGYTYTLRDADYTTDNLDVGYHLVILNITDNEGLADWQNLTIQVRCNTTNTCCNESLDYHFRDSECNSTSNCTQHRDGACIGEKYISNCDSYSGDCEYNHTETDYIACYGRICDQTKVVCSGICINSGLYNCPSFDCNSICDLNSNCVSPPVDDCCVNKYKSNPLGYCGTSIDSC